MAMRKARKPLLALLAIVLAVGFANPFLGPPRQGHQPLDLVLFVGASICLFAWCKADAAERGIAPGSAAALAGLLGPLGVLCYFVRTMSPRQAVIAGAKAVGFLLLLSLADALAGMAAAWLRHH